MDISDIKFGLFRLNQQEYEHVGAMHPQWSEAEVRQQAEANMAELWSDVGSDFRSAMYESAQEIGCLSLLDEVRKHDLQGKRLPTAAALKILSDYGGTAAVILAFEKMQAIRRVTLPEEGQIVPRRRFSRLVERCRRFMFRSSRHG